MKTHFKQLIEELAGSPSPGRLSEILVEFSSWYALLSEELKDILVFKPGRQIEMKANYKTVKEAEWAWEASEEGKKETALEIELKYLEKSMSAIKTRLRALEGERYGY